ncbi:MAG TPA: GNAT family N-acetyltransferase, partial [bacterium]|nr:GNAT family N-acetyltransferase [bacterium]
IESLLAKQQAVMSDQQDRDVFGVAIEASKACVQLFKVRNGILIGREEFTMDCSAAVDAEEVLERTLVSYYEKAFEIPTEILIPQEMENAPVLSEWFGSLRAALAADRRLPQLVVPVRGEKKSLVDLVSTNAKQRLDELLGEWMTKEQRRNQALAELKDVLQLPRKPERIECFDISHLGGEGTVGAMAVFHAGEPRNSDYRRFKVQTIEGGDDYAALREVLTRRFERLQGMGIGLEGLTLRQPTDKAMKFIEERIMAERLDNSDLAPEQFLALRYKGEIVGFGRVKLYLPADDATGEHAVPIHELASLWIKPELRGKRLGYLLLSELIRKFKAKVFYGLTSEGHVPYYEGFGFKCIAAVPPVFSKKITHACASWGPVVCLRYDTTTKRKEDLSFKAMPDLVVIDGGKGQLSTAVEVMHELRLYHPEEVKLAGKKKKAPKTKSPKKQKVWGLFAFPIVGLAKEEEQLFVPWQSEPIPLAADSAGSLLVQALRDETHRFAITYQKKVRSKQMFK